MPLQRVLLDELDVMRLMRPSRPARLVVNQKPGSGVG